MPFSSLKNINRNMQILHWPFKAASKDQQSPAPSSKKGKEVKSKDVVLLKNHPEASRRTRKRGERFGFVCEDSNIFNILFKKDIGNACFCGTLNLKRVRSVRKRQHFVHSMKMKREDLARGLGISAQKAADSANNSHVGNKVLPISDHSSTGISSFSTNENDQCSSTTEKKEKTKSDKTKAISKMKDLLRWAAAAKSEKGGKYLSRKVLQFRNKPTLKSVPDDDQLSNDSPKISFKWDVESCSTTSSAYSAMSYASSSKNGEQAMSLPSIKATLHNPDFSAARTGNWITTDSEFVVLEL